MIDTFVKNGHYDEAMDLCLFSHRIRSRYPDLEILRHICDQVDQASQRMLNQLITLLSGAVKLPLCIRVIGYLKRLDVYSDSDLKWVFLSQRDAFMEFLLGQVKSNEPGEYLKKYLEVSRETFFDILTQ